MIAAMRAEFAEVDGWLPTPV